MFFTMMHKTFPVLDFEIRYGRVHSIIKIHNEARIPLNLINNLTENNLEKWIRKRFVPEQRPNFKKFYKDVYKKDIWLALKFTSGFNLSDQYWFREDEISSNWQECNYFSNNFNYEVGNYLIMNQELNKNMCIVSPDLFTNGNNPKTWRIKNNQRYLLKGSMCQNEHDCINEKIMADYINELNIPYLTCPDTELTKIKGEVFSCSKNFITENTELVPAQYIVEYKKKEETKQLYHHLEDMCIELKIPNAKSFLNTMLAIDSFTCQTDRHLGNFGFIRNVNTLEFIGPAPLYDNGNCLWFKDDTRNIGTSLFDLSCKPFASFHKEQDKLIDDKNVLKYIDVDVFEKVLERNAKGLLDSKRIKKISREVEKRAKDLEKVVKRDRAKKIEKEGFIR